MYVEEVVMRAEPGPFLPLPIDAYPLRDLLFCAGCGQQLYPLQLASGPRAYRSPCGCRMTPTDAATIERRVHDTAATHTPALTATEPESRHATVYRALFVEVLVGGTVDDLTFVWRR